MTVESCCGCVIVLSVSVDLFDGWRLCLKLVDSAIHLAINRRLISGVEREVVHQLSVDGDIQSARRRH
eukprot:scaffold18197_cov111-Skeletonema_dohrnii-CCMP3373.AAC.1